MAIYPSKSAGYTVVAFLALSCLPAAWANDLDSIRFGDGARTFAAGSIQQTTPQDGAVNVITGDNQTSGNRMRLGQHDVFYLKLKNPDDVAVGDLYTVFKRARKVFHPVTRQYMGYLINRLAVVQVIQVDSKLTTVKAIRAFGSVSSGDPVAKFALPSPVEPASIAESEDVKGMIIELQSDMGLTLVAQHNIVYLDRGAEDGLKVGSQLELLRYGGGLPVRSVGEIRVLSTEARTATALVTKSTSRILVGDRFHMKTVAGEPAPVPVSQSAGQLSDSSSAQVSGNIQAQNATRETRFSLHDLTKQLHYDSGEATIKPEGYQVLDRVVEQLKAASPDQLIRVEGHADNMEIGPSLKSVYPTNWDLSKARANGVLRYLIEKGGIDSARISSIGYGDTKPVVSNATEAGRQRNRRVDVVLYSPETPLAPAEQAMKPAETVEEGNRTAQKVSEGKGSAMSAADPEVSADLTKTENSAAISDPVISDAPASEGQPGSGSEAKSTESATK